MFVVLSDKYLKSPNCMYELMEVWRNCKLEPEALRRRIRVYRTTDAAMSRPIERVGYAKYWRDQFRNWMPLCMRTRACWARPTSSDTD